MRIARGSADYLRNLCASTSLSFRWVVGLGAVAASGFFCPAAAEQVSLAQAYDRMVQSGIEFGLIDADLKASVEGVRQAKGQRLPRVEITLQYDQIQQKVLSSDNTAYATGTSQYPKLTVNFTLRQPIYDASRFRALPLAKAQDAVRQAEGEVAVNRVVRDLISAYFNVAQAQLQVDRAKAIVQGRKDYERSLQEDIDAGRREESALTRAQGDTLSAEGDQMSAESSMFEALAELQRYAGVDVTGVAMDSSRLGVVDLASLTSTMTADNLLTMSPDLQSAEAALEVAKRGRAKVKGALMPSVDFVLDFEHQATDGSLFGGGSKTQTVTGGVMLTVPVYEGGIKRSQLREADIGITSAELRVKQIQQSVSARFEALMASAKLAASRSGKLGAEMGLARDAVQTAQEQFDAGRSSEGALLEQKLRLAVLDLDVRAARLQQLRIQAELYALFGAFDMKTISEQAGG